MISIIALAAWVVVSPNGFRETWDKEPVIGVNVPVGSKVIPLKKGTPERDLYFVQDNGDVVRPVVEPLPPQADTRSFQLAIFSDQDIPLPAKVELLKFFPLVERHPEPEYLKPVWAALVAVYGDSWLTKEVQTKVEAYAEAFHLEVK